MTQNLRKGLMASAMAVFALTSATACTPTVRVETPDRPITINLNVNISHEIRVRVDRDLESEFDENSGIF